MSARVVCKIKIPLLWLGELKNTRDRNKLWLKKEIFQQVSSHGFCLNTVRELKWNTGSAIWGWENQCVSHLRVWCYLKLLLLLPVSAWSLCCCSVPAGRSLWSSSTKTSSPAEFLPAQRCDGCEPTQQLQLHVKVRCELQVNSHRWWERCCLTPHSCFLHSLVQFGHDRSV